MNLGLFDLAGPVLSWLDQALAAIVPAAGRLVLWGLVAAILSMALYAALSPQQRLRRIRDEAVAARCALDRFGGRFAGARPRSEERRVGTACLRRWNFLRSPVKQTTKKMET